MKLKVSIPILWGLGVLGVSSLLWGEMAAASVALAQGHAGHSSQTVPLPTEKFKTVKQRVKALPSPEDVAEEPPQVEITPEQQQAIGVKTVRVAVKPIRKVIRTVGRIEADERRLATVNAKVEGWIEKLYVDYTGRVVKKGEPLAELYSPELLATQQEFLGILKWVGKQTSDSALPGADHAGHEGAPPAVPPVDSTRTSGAVPHVQRMIEQDASATLDAARQRLRLWDISEAQIRRIEETGRPIRTLTLYSPVDGTITQKMAVLGMRVMPGEKLFDIEDLSTLWVIADIYEYELPLIRVGQQARLTLGALPGRELVSRIDYLYPTISADSRTAKVRLTLPNPGGRFKPQMFMNVEIRIDSGRRLAIPESAVIDTGRGQVVYVDRGGGAFEPREVQLGLRADGFAEVLRGLKAGEKVAAAANFLIDSEAQLKGVKPLRRP
jgi:Cu(I)/Ag(I) efflux system membrane fusion protein